MKNRDLKIPRSIGLTTPSPLKSASASLAEKHQFEQTQIDRVGDAVVVQVSVADVAVAVAVGVDADRRWLRSRSCPRRHPRRHRRCPGAPVSRLNEPLTTTASVAPGMQPEVSKNRQTCAWPVAMSMMTHAPLLLNGGFRNSEQRACRRPVRPSHRSCRRWSGRRSRLARSTAMLVVDRQRVGRGRVGADERLQRRAAGDFKVVRDNVGSRERRTGATSMVRSPLTVEPSSSAANESQVPVHSVMSPS